MKLTRKIALLGLSSLALLGLSACGEEESGNGPFYWYSNYESYVRTEDSLAVYTFHFSIAFLENDDPIALKKEDFKIVDGEKNIVSNGFLKNISISSMTVNGEKKENVNFDLLEETKQEKIDGVWSDTIVSFAESFNYKTCSFLYKGKKAEVRPGYTLE